MTVDNREIRRQVLEVVAELADQGEGRFQLGPIINKSAQRVAPKTTAEEQALLTVIHDLFRTGHLSWGYNLSNPEPPFCHLTERGRRTLSSLSRDPSNPDGYIRYLNEKAQLNPIAESYIKEALNTYNSNCFKASAVMVGGAAESVILQLRDILVSKMESLGQTPSKSLKDWRVKRVLDSMKNELDKQKKKMPQTLIEAFESYWPAFTQQIRAVRNEAGHPQSVTPIGDDAVHASLLIFPELAKLASDLASWINSNF